MTHEKIIRVEHLPVVTAMLWRGRVITDVASFEIFADVYGRENFELVTLANQETDDLFLVKINRGSYGPRIQIQGSETAVGRFWRALNEKAPMPESGFKTVIDDIAQQQQAQRARQ